MKMGAKILKFIKTIIVLFFIGIIVVIGFIIYNEIKDTDVASEVQEFVSNITVVDGGTDLNEIKTPQIIQSTTETITAEDEHIDYTSSNINKYFYNQLDKYSKIIYNALDENKENMKNGTYEINLGTEFSNILSNDNGQKELGDYYQTAIEAYSYDNPDVFYIDFQKLYLNIETTTRGTSKTYKVFLNAGNSSNYLENQFQTKESVDIALNEIQKIKAYFVQNKKQDTYQNIKLVHDYLVETIEYDQSTSRTNTYNLYGALIEKNCVCEGYAKAFKYLMDGLNIPCTIVAGNGTNSEGVTESHAWNYVQLNENWYAVDTTWDDPILLGGGILTNSSKYKYFLKGANEFNSSHFANGQFTEGGKKFVYPQISEQNY